MHGYQKSDLETMEITERRISDRITVSLDALVTTQDGDTYEVRVADISSSGLKFLVDNFQIPKLMPPQDREHKIDTIPLQIDILLPGQFGEVKVRLGIVYFSRVSVHQSAMGCRFEEFIENSSGILAEYVHSVKEAEVHTENHVRRLRKGRLTQV